MMHKVVCLGLTAAGVATGAPMRYDGHRVYALSQLSREALEGLKSEFYNIDVWKDRTFADQEASVRVEPERQAAFLSAVAAAGASASVAVEDLQAVIDVENVLPPGPLKNDSFYSQYHNYNDTMAWVATLPAKYPHLASTLTVGSTYEGRTLTAVKISGSATKGGAGKIGLWMDSLIHAREWITGGTVNYMIGTFLDQYGKVDEVTKILDSADLYFLPIFNADGYDYTWHGERLWRKTREPNQGSRCVGVDPNRNWDFHWKECGESSDPCSDEYSGPYAFAAKCVKTVTDYIASNKQIVGYINFHSDAQMWLSPWGWTTKKPADYEAQNAISAASVKALEAVHGTRFTYGNIASTIYCASGSSADWVYGAINRTFAYAAELRGPGFNPPASDIVPSGEEVFAGVKVWASMILQHYEEVGFPEW